ncbi:PKD domain-containing protein [Flagellimonas sp. DF-77]|uniref:PKD domain-containing protein n=1 Tax=Flagellimonas algarum TaxID=3230298 RepID=UPI003392613D
MELFNPNHTGTGIFDEVTVNVVAGITCNDTDFPSLWEEHQIDGELPYRALYIFPDHDIDGDGLKDIVTGGWWYRNPGTASGTWDRFDIGGTFANVAHVYDFDGDGDMDLFGTEGAYIGVDLVWAQNDGSGNFTVYTDIPAGTAVGGEEFIAGLAGGVYEENGPYQMAITWNRGEGGNSEVQMVTVPADPVNGTWTVENIHPTSLGEGLSNGDIDGDGDLDLFQAGNWLRNDSGSWTLFSTGITFPTTFDRNRLSDIDRDGDLDGVVGQIGGSQELAWFEAPADPTQPWTKNVIEADIDAVLSMDVVDFDFDGDDDVIVGEWRNQYKLFAFENDLCDSGTWIKHELDAGGGTIDHHDGAQVADIDNDGDLDVVSQGWRSVVPRVYENGTFSPSNRIPIADAGNDITMTLPSNSAVLNGNGTDPDGGAIVSYAWTQESGPSVATLGGADTATLNASDLVMGSYVFRLTITDDEGDTDFDEATVTVLPDLPILRINSGGPDFTFNGQAWSADDYFSGGGTFTRVTSIGNTDNDELYQTERFANSGTMTYEIPVSVGNYNINLHFAELFFGLPGGGSSGGIGSRTFDVDIENGQAQLEDYDIFATAGGPAIAVVESFNGIVVNDGFLTVTLTSVIDNAKISGIEILGTGIPVANAGPDIALTLPASSTLIDGSANDPDGGSIVSYAWTQESGPAAATLSGEMTEDLSVSDLIPGTYVFRLTVTDDEAETGFDEVTVTVAEQPDVIRINSGGPDFTFSGNEWIADNFFSGGMEFSRVTEIANTDNDQLYQTERFANSGSFTYEIQVNNGSYDLNLHFAELFFGLPGAGSGGGIGSRIFDVDIENGQAQLDDFDIFATAGGAAIAVVENFSNIIVSDGFLSITFSSVVDNAKISGLEIFDNSAASQIPVANAGLDQNIFLPTDTSTMNGSGNDPDGGAIVSYAWTQESGPNTATLSGENTQSLTASDLVEGSYTFRLTVTDDEAETGFDDVVINVISQPQFFRINAGGPTFNFGGDDWFADEFFIGGDDFERLTSIGNTTNDELYQTERFADSGSFSYEIPVVNGNYDINLHFAELFFGLPGAGSGGGVGSRVFSVDIENGQGQLENYDIFQTAGGAALAVVEGFTGIQVTDGSLTITFTSVVDNAKVSGLEVIFTEVPVVEAGTDVEITLPTDQVVLNGDAQDPDGGSIVSLLWTQQSGPETATLSGETTLILTADDLVAGTYVFRLTAEDDEGDTAFDEVTVTVFPENMAPVAVIEADPLTGDAPLEVAFTGSGSTDDVGIVSYAWDFDDGGSSTDADPTYTFTTAGTYDVVLTVTDGGGLTDSETVTIEVTVPNQAPDAVASADPLTGDAPLEVAFTGSASTDDVGIVSYAWDFADGGTATEADPTYTFNTPGTYQVELTVTDGGGLTDTANVTIVVGQGNEAPMAIITADPLTGTVPLEVNFTGSGSTDDVAVVSYAWDFGDGGSSTDADPTYTFTAVGSYTVTLTVIDGGGLSDSETVTIEVVAVPNEAPVAIATADPISGEAPLEVAFTGSGSTDDVAVVSYAWDFGDGGSSIDADPTYTFTTPGTFDVELTVTDGGGLSDTTTVTIEVEDNTPTSSGDMVDAVIVPNPATAVANVQILEIPEDRVLVKLYLHDSTGRVLGSYAPSDVFVEGRYEVPIETLRDGLYFVVLEFSRGDDMPIRFLIKN